MSFICAKCGLLSADKAPRCPRCFGTLTPLPQPYTFWKPTELDGRQQLASITGNLDSCIKRATKHIGTGSDHLRRKHYESAANAFRRAMEAEVKALMLMASEDKVLLRGWICADKNLCCKRLNDVTFVLADQANFLLANGFVSPEHSDVFDFLRSRGNAGSHDGGYVSKKDAFKARDYAKEFLAQIKEVKQSIAEVESDQWSKICYSKAHALCAYSNRLMEDVNFLTEKNNKTAEYITRKTNFIAGQNRHLEWAKRNSTRRDVQTTLAKISDANAEIESARYEIAERSREVQDLEGLRLQIHFDLERLLSVYDPSAFQKKQVEYERYKQGVLADEQRQREELQRKQEQAARTRKVLLVVVAAFAIVAITALLFSQSIN